MRAPMRRARSRETLESKLPTKAPASARRNKVATKGKAAPAAWGRGPKVTTEVRFALSLSRSSRSSSRRTTAASSLATATCFAPTAAAWSRIASARAASSISETKSCFFAPLEWSPYLSPRRRWTATTLPSFGHPVDRRCASTSPRSAADGRNRVPATAARASNCVIGDSESLAEASTSYPASYPASYAVRQLFSKRQSKNVALHQLALK
mmetsp:Transcript_33111/g.105690  ORF Transcript_33111/g.105690 Transcript_33111/m.105690 type:complete len:210 (+) Transcript_33111:251-880(+)